MRIINLILGILFLALGIIGVYLPILPTTPFLLLAAFFLARSSEKLHTRLINSKIYRENVAPIQRGSGMTIRRKARILAIVSLLFGLSLYFMKNKIGRTVVLIILIFHWIFFIFGIKTISQEEEEKRSQEYIEGLQAEENKSQS